MLSWRSLGELGCYATPVHVRGTRQHRRRLVSVLAAEIVGAHGTTLWIGSEQVARPLAWLPVREQRLDARPPRSELGEQAWPGVNPFDLDSGLLADWLRIEVDSLRTWPATRIRECLDFARGKDMSSRVHPATRTFASSVDWARNAGLPVPVSFAGTRRPRAVRERTTICFPAGSLTVVCGHHFDLADRIPEVVLLVLAFVSAVRAAGAADGQRLIVIDGAWPLFSRDHQELLANVLMAFVERGEGRVLIAEQQSIGVPSVPAWESMFVELSPLDASGDSCLVRLPGDREVVLRVPVPLGLECT